MSKLNYTFFEEFKRLDRLCKEIYNSDLGLTNYINDMKSISKNDYIQIANFESDLKNLIHLRHIRNYLAHNEGGFNEDICTQNDINTLREFYNRILNVKDPLSIVYKNKKQQKNIYKKAFYTKKTISQKTNSETNWLCWFIVLIIIVLLCVIPYCSIL